MTSLTRKQTPAMKLESALYWVKRQEILEDPRVKEAPLWQKQQIIDQIRKERGL